MADGEQHTPHPLVTNPTLWAVDVPAHLKWLPLLELLKACGEVRSGGRGTTPDGRSRWALTFSDIYHGEPTDYPSVALNNNTSPKPRWLSRR